MIFEKINTISTAIIAYVTMVGLMSGLYFNLKALNISLIYILLFETIFIFSIWLFISWIKIKVKNAI